MKHLLNDLTEQEKNSIREQHTGGMKVVTENFSRLINTKSGDVKPLVNEDTTSEPIVQLTKDDFEANFQFLDGKKRNILKNWEVKGDNQVHIYAKPNNFDYEDTHIVFFLKPNKIKINKATNNSEDVKATKGTGGYIQIVITNLHLKAFNNANKVGQTLIKTMNTQDGFIYVYLHLDPKSSMSLGSEL
jgi:hypothetical protein